MFVVSVSFCCVVKIFVDATKSGFFSTFDGKEGILFWYVFTVKMRCFSNLCFDETNGIFVSKLEDSLLRIKVQ